jgi:choline dehydrogenase-like flavoprotein
MYNLTSLPQAGLNNRRNQIFSAAVVGGGSAVNGMYGDRGAAIDYDNWEALGNPGWGFQGLLPYFKKVRRQPNSYLCCRNGLTRRPRHCNFILLRQRSLISTSHMISLPRTGMIAALSRSAIRLGSGLDRVSPFLDRQWPSGPGLELTQVGRDPMESLARVGSSASYRARRRPGVWSFLDPDPPGPKNADEILC